MKMIFSLFLLFSFSALAQDLRWLTTESVDLSRIPAPPVENSAEDLNDLEIVILVQGARTEADCKKSAIEAEGFATSFYGSAYGPLTDEEASKLVAFQENLFKEVMVFSRMLKDQYARIRPYNRTERVRPCIKTHRSLSYPSGHTTVAYVSSRAFALIYPEHKDAFYKRANEISWGRVVGGVHHPLDTVAGKLMGEEIFKALVKEESFMKELKGLRQ